MAQSRKILFFLGAGASLGAGAYATVQAGGRIPIPTQATFWETFLRFCRNSQRRKTIESFLFRYFLGYHKVPSRSKPSDRRKLLNIVDVEEVFTFLSERVRAPSTSPQLRAYANEVWDALVSEIGPVFSHFPPNQSSRNIFRELVTNHVRQHDAIVSFNYDTVFESSLQNGFPWGYEGIEDTTKCLRILKPHGSVDWELDGDNQVHRVTNPARSVIVAPTHLKFVSVSDSDSDGTASLTGYLDQSPQIEGIWQSMETHMRKSKALVFIGYSFPVADLYFSSILRTALATRDQTPGIVLVNPDSVALGSHLEARFKFPKIVRYFDMEQFVQTNRQNLLANLGL